VPIIKYEVAFYENPTLSFITIGFVPMAFGFRRHEYAGKHLITGNIAGFPK
jgi:hypothetical protein